jgi:hypothetical protein
MGAGLPVIGELSGAMARCVLSGDGDGGYALTPPDENAYAFSA